MFKIGDLIKVKPGRESYALTGFIKGEVVRVIKDGFSGKGMFIKVLESKDVGEIGVERFVCSLNYEKIPDDKIIIYRQGNKVTAKNVSTKEEAVAKCHPDDEFDFSIGARLALDRLCGNPKSDLFVARSVYEQVCWERDIATEGLKKAGLSFGEEPKETNLQHYLAEIMTAPTHCMKIRDLRIDDVDFKCGDCVECRNENLKWLKEEYKG